MAFLVPQFIKEGVQNMYSNYVAPPTEPQFLLNGNLSPDEFVAAGDKLVSISPEWKWKTCSEEKYLYKYLPKDKQYIEINGVLCQERIKDYERRLQQSNFQIQEIEDFDDDQQQQQQQNQQQQQQQEQKNNEEQKKQQQQQQEQQSEEKPSLRKYDISICYDAYYYTPKLYLKAVDQDDKPINQQGILEDINPNMVDKTATFINHPHNGVSYLYVHPCKQAQALKERLESLKENGDESGIGAHIALILCLEFFSIVAPRIEFTEGISI